jgi:molecular chaperone DnaK (HSP70)
VILIGGMTHIPKVQTLVQDYFGKVPNIMNDGTVVALGAAIQGGIIKGDIKMP